MIEYDEAFQLYIPPTMYAEIILCFDRDFATDEVNSVINLDATDALQWSDTIINPLTNTHNLGYWEYQTEKVVSFDGNDLFLLLHDLLTSHKAGFQQVIRDYLPTDVILRVFILIHQEGIFPSIQLERYLVEDIFSLNAMFDIVIDNDFEKTGDGFHDPKLKKGNNNLGSVKN